MRIAILVDDINSWFVPYSHKLKEKLQSDNIVVNEYNNSKEVGDEDICFILSCTKILKKEFLDKHRHNIVVHASDLPKGKGFTPLKWQILEGKNDIPLTLFEAVEACDAGPYYFKDVIHFEGYEMLDEMQHVMANKIIDMCCLFVQQIEDLLPIQQKGESTYYRKFNKEDDDLNIDFTLKQLFPRFRIADFERFPLTFEKDGHHYSMTVKRID